jgi:hypothetical protein
MWLWLVQLVECSGVDWSWGLRVVGQLAACKNVSMESDGIVGIRHQATTDKDIAGWEDLVHAEVHCKMCVLAIAL